MKTNIAFRDLRDLLLGLGFREKASPEHIVFHHPLSDTLFVFRPYRLRDPVASYNLIEVRQMLEARGLMTATAFENRFKKTPA